MHTFLIGGAMLALGAGCAAQGYVIAPDNAAITQPTQTTLTWRSAAFHTQWIYDTSHFTNLGVTGSCQITRLRFRSANNTVNAGGQYVGDGATVGVTLDIGTCTSDFAAVSSTYGTNRGTMQNVLTFGTVTVAPGAGTTPNNIVIDIPIPGGFAYDPSLGQDLLIDVTGPAFTGSLPLFPTGSSGALHRCARVSGTAASTTGSIVQGGGSIILFDIVGSGGLPDNGFGSPILDQASGTAYGTGCGPTRTRSFAELFPAGAGTTLDLGTSIAMVPDILGAPTSYAVLPGSAAYLTPAGVPLLNNATVPGALLDDSMSQACNLGFSFPFPGGSTTVVHANTNGYIVLGPTANSGGDFSATVGELVAVGTSAHSGLPRLCPVWYDFHAARNVSTNPAAGLYFDIDPVNQKAYLTWSDFGESATATAGTKSFNFQVELSADGSVEYRYGAMTSFGSTSLTGGVKLVGFSPGGGALAPAQTDLSVAIPFLTGSSDLLPLELAVSGSRIGGTATFSTAWVPLPGVTLTWLSAVQISTGLDLTPTGLPGCSAYMDPTALILDSINFGTGTTSFGVAIPFDLTLIGVNAYAQSAALNPGYNAFGATTSNGVVVHVGTVL